MPNFIESLFNVEKNCTSLRFFFLGVRGGGVNKMEYLTVFRIVLGYVAWGRMIATLSSNAADHVIRDGTTENDAKYREIVHFIDTSPCAKTEKLKYKV